jgi:zinc transporter 1
MIAYFCYKGALVNAVFLVSVCLGILIEAIERLFEQKHIHEPKLLLLVGCIGLAINLLGLFIFGHSHSHNLPAIPNEDSDDEECDESLKLIITESKIDTANANDEDGKPEVPSEIAIKQPNKKDSDKIKKKKKPTKCHILCKIFALFSLLNSNV